MKDPTVNKASQFLNGKTTEIFIFFYIFKIKSQERPRQGWYVGLQLYMM